MNYVELSTLIENMTSNHEASFLTAIPQFVRATEQRIIQDAKLPLQQNSTTIPTVAGVDTINVGAVNGYLAVDSLAVTVGNSYRYLDNKEEEFLRAAFPNPTVQGTPRLYNVYDHATLKLAPSPDAVYTLQLRYFSYPNSIVDTGTSWLGTNFPFALQYGSLRDAAIYLKEEADVIAMYERMYAEAMTEIKNFADKRASVDNYRTRS